MREARDKRIYTMYKKKDKTKHLVISDTYVCNKIIKSINWWKQNSGRRILGKRKENFFGKELKVPLSSKLLKVPSQVCVLSLKLEGG